MLYSSSGQNTRLSIFVLYVQVFDRDGDLRMDSLDTISYHSQLATQDLRLFNSGPR